MGKKVVIIGGVAGGASCAARLRRLSEETEIVLLERGGHISYANCGLPYYIGEVIKEREKLFVMTPQKFMAWFNIDVRVNSEAVSIDRAEKKVEVSDQASGKRYWESYDQLVLSPGAAPFSPPLAGIDCRGIFTLRSVADSDRIHDFIREVKPESAVVVGGGFIGLEMAENLHNRGLAVTVIELAPQILPNLDPEMATLAQQYLRARGVSLYLGDGVERFSEGSPGLLTVSLQSGRELTAGLVILAIGVKPETSLARSAGLEVGRGIRVNEYLQSSDPDIYALGDAIEVKDLITGRQTVIPLAGPANKQGRIVANNLAGRKEAYHGTQGSAVLKLFDLIVASTGAGERSLKEAGLEFMQCIIQPNAHAGYYPGGSTMVLKLLFSPQGRIYGAQALGYSGVDKRIDVVAAAIRSGQSVYDLQALELAYAPPFSSAKDPVNMAGYVAGNLIQGDLRLINGGDLLESQTGESRQLVDVREAEEFSLGQIPGAVNIPLGELRRRTNEISRDKSVVLYCAVGLRSYLAARILMNKGFKDVKSLNGGYRIYRALRDELNRAGDENKVEAMVDSGSKAVTEQSGPVIELDCCGLQCPGPIVKVFQKINELPEGALLEICATDPGFVTDIKAWCRRTGHTLVRQGTTNRGFTALVRKGISGSGEANSAATKTAAGNDKTIVVFSGDLDRAIAAFIIANGAAAMGRKVTLFFTFWGLNILRKPERIKVIKPFMDRMFGMMMPRGSKKLGLSRMNMLGMGPQMIRRVMAGKNVDSLEALIEQALAAGIRLVACQMSMEVMGITAGELIDGVELGGVASYLDSAEDSDINLFI